MMSRPVSTTSSSAPPTFDETEATIAIATPHAPPTAIPTRRRGPRSEPAEAEAGAPEVFSALESRVRSYCRSWPVVFDTALGARMTDIDGRSYLDFFAGAGALNYGHNNPACKRALLDYLTRDGVVHGLDMHTRAKAEFLATFEELVLRPRGLNYKIQFPGPTGTNAVESALKLVRKVTGREAMINFTHAFHGMTLGSLSVTGNSMKRGGAGVPLVHATPMPTTTTLTGGCRTFCGSSGCCRTRVAASTSRPG
jgi:diaminobutyrate-2-oxoglutarate transaminase